MNSKAKKGTALIAAALAALALSACGGSTEAQLIRAARESCPHGLASVKFHNDGTKSLERVVCR
jgi:hypothetical protein